MTTTSAKSAKSADEPANPHLDEIRNRWGIEDYRPLQSEAIQAALNRRDSLVVMPTGGGKSLCYQGPAVCLGGVTIVISPLIALMQDQVDALRVRGVAASFFNSTQHPREHAEIEALVKRGEIDLLYASPERALQPAFLTMLANLYACYGLAAIVIDEAHCISQWGHDFRPEYAKLGKMRTLFHDVPIHAYTATATPHVRDEIIESLHLCNPAVLVGDFDRPNLHLFVEQRTDLDRQLVGCISMHHNATARSASPLAKGGLRGVAPGLVYCNTRAESERLAKLLIEHDIDADCYHAGMDDDSRRRVQEAWMAGDTSVVCATIAFGMGIDRADVRYVIHAEMPSSIEQYHQQIGRAGRDGLPADCIVFWDPGDADMWHDRLTSPPYQGGAGGGLSHPYQWVAGGVSSEFHDPVTESRVRVMWLMDAYCRSTVCRHNWLVSHFGQEHGGDCGGDCGGACDNCRVRRVDHGM